MFSGCIGVFTYKHGLARGKISGDNKIKRATKPMTNDCGATVKNTEFSQLSCMENQGKCAT